MYIISNEVIPVSKHVSIIKVGAASHTAALEERQYMKAMAELINFNV